MYIFENNIAVLHLEPQIEAVRVAYKTFFSDNEDLREVLTKATELLSDKKFTKLIADSSIATDAICQSDMEWMMGTFFPNLAKNGLTKFAIIAPKDLVARLTVEDWIDENTSVEMPFEIRLLNSLEEGMEWMK